MRNNISNAFVSTTAIIATALTFTLCATVFPKSVDVTLNFPEKTVGIAERAYTIPEFELNISLPEGWSLGDKTEHEYYSCIIGELTEIFDENGQVIGTIGSSDYTDYYSLDPDSNPAPFSEGYWKSVYPNLRLSARRNWDIDPSTSIKTANGETMLSKIYTQIPNNELPAAAWETVETEGIVSYNSEKFVYIFIEFTSDINTQTMNSIAESISID